MNLTLGLSIFSSFCFIIYAIQCLTTTRMREEFERWGVSQLRYPTGALQLLAGVGLIVGLRWHPALILSSGGLTLMMLIALVVRGKIKDGVVPSLPAALLMVVNATIFYLSLRF